MTWWPLAWSEELAGKPLAVRVDAQELVLFRDRTGAAFAFEDRCAHRRVPLSLGRVTEHGTLQCGYHGWCYEGATGRCVAIPNFRPGERISARVGVRAYATAEVRGVVFARIGAETHGPAGPPALDELKNRVQRRSGETPLALAHAAWVESLLNDPIGSLGLSDTYTLGAPSRIEARDQTVVLQPLVLAATGTRARFRHAAAALVGHLTVWGGSGLAQLLATDAAQRCRLSIVAASVPLSEQKTLVRWRVATSTQARTGSRLAWLTRAALPAPPVQIRVDAGSLHASTPAGAAALAWRELSQRESSCDPMTVER